MPYLEPYKTCKNRSITCRTTTNILRTMENLPSHHHDLLYPSYTFSSLPLIPAIPLKSHPFIEFIMIELVPQTYQPSTHLKLYDGMIDPQSHVDAFKNTMLILGDFDSMCCKAFPSTLSEAAQQWFSSLPSHLPEVLLI